MCHTYWTRVLFFFHSLCMSSYGYIYFDVCFLFVVMMGAAIFDILHRSYRTLCAEHSYAHTHTCTGTGTGTGRQHFPNTHAYVHIRTRAYTHTNATVQAVLSMQKKRSNISTCTLSHTRTVCMVLWEANLPYDSLNIRVDTKTTVVWTECEPKWIGMEWNELKRTLCMEIFLN